MKHNISILITGLAGLLLLTPSCMDILDKQAETTVTQEQVFGSETRTREFLNNVYSYLPNDFYYLSSHASFSDVLCDNAININAWDPYPTVIRTGSISSTNNPEEWRWSDAYTSMRKANKFLENVGDSPVPNVARANDDDNMLKDRYIAEARILRAIYHFEAMKRFGKIVIADHSFQTDELNPVRDEISEIVEFIVKEVDEAKASLPLVYTSTTNIGRINRMAALALKSRVLLYGASPLYNNGNDATLWEQAAAAAKEVIDNAPQAGIALMDDFQELFIEQFNKEIILCRSSWSTYTIEAESLPHGLPGGSNGTTQPTQNLVDCFEMTDGTSFDWNNPTHAANPYANRDPRLWYTVIFHGSTVINNTIDFTLNSGVHDSNTGYNVRKWVNPNYDPTQKKALQRNSIIFRYGEILLNFAEAMNEAYGPDGGPYGSMTARWAVNTLRARPTVKMPEYPSGLSKEQFRTRIQNERRVELAFEGHRYFDVRRWMKISDLNEVRGVHIINEGGTLRYERVVLETKQFDDKFYFFPVPYEELIKAPNLGQNQGW